MLPSVSEQADGWSPTPTAGSGTDLNGRSDARIGSVAGSGSMGFRIALGQALFSNRLRFTAKDLGVVVEGEADLCS